MAIGKLRKEEMKCFSQENLPPAGTQNKYLIYQNAGTVSTTQLLISVRFTANINEICKL
jgi:hypothetical protein